MRDMNTRKRIEALEAALRPAGVRAWFARHHLMACDQDEREALTAPGTPHERKRAILAAHGCPDPTAIDADNVVGFGAGAVLLQPAADRLADVVEVPCQTLQFGPYKVWF